MGRLVQIALLSMAGVTAALLLIARSGANPVSSIAAVSAGSLHTCALTTGGGVTCWGANASGQLGDGTTAARTTPGDVAELTSGVAAVSAGGSHTCGLTTAGGVACWGANGYGQLGDGTTTDRTMPVAVSGLTSGVAAVSAGGVHTCALTDAGAVKCWGANFFGQLGNGTATGPEQCTGFYCSTTPVAVSGLSSGVAAVAAGGNHACALTTGGGVTCWGDNDHGQLGDGTTATYRTTPADVAGLTSGVAAVSARGLHACALTTGGGLKCWGGNGSGELGDGTTSDRRMPVDVSGLAGGVAAVSAGDLHTCALTTGGEVRCWGYNFYGQLGDGTTVVYRSTPAGVAAISGVAAIAAGGVHTCALASGGGVMCWGANYYGQLGDGTTAQRAAPVAVAAPGKATPTPTPDPRLAGDADCSGRVDSIDAAIVLQHGAGLLASLSCRDNADVNGDSRVTAVDAALILQYSAGLLRELAAGGPR